MEFLVVLDCLWFLALCRQFVKISSLLLRVACSFWNRMYLVHCTSIRGGKVDTAWYKYKYKVLSIQLADFMGGKGGWGE